MFLCSFPSFLFKMLWYTTCTTKVTFTTIMITSIFILFVIIFTFFTLLFHFWWWNVYFKFLYDNVHNYDPCTAITITKAKTMTMKIWIVDVIAFTFENGIELVGRVVWFFIKNSLFRLTIRRHKINSKYFSNPFPWYYVAGKN